MSSLDLKQLVGGGAAVRRPVAGSVIGRLIHEPKLRTTQAQPLRKMDSVCEILEPGAQSGGFGQTDGNHVILYSGPCAVGQRQPVGETASVGAATNAASEWEIAVPLGVLNVSPKARIAVPGWLNEWRPSRAYAISRSERGIFGEKVIPTDLDTGSGLYFECVQEGTSGTVEPVWTNQLGTTVADGEAVWRCVGVVTYYDVIGVADAQSNRVETVIRCKVIE